jgi:uncharacterized Zn finger protein
LPAGLRADLPVGWQPGRRAAGPPEGAGVGQIRQRLADLEEGRRLADERARRQGRKPGGRIAFGTTWWGRAWIEALEHRAQLDPNRLPRGRSYARSGRVGALVVENGEVRAPVYGSRIAAYRVRVRVRSFSQTEWSRAIDAIAAKAGHAAALLDGELAPEIKDDLDGAGLALLPGPGDIATGCTCPDWANPCKHAAAVCYLVAEVLDRDPFTVFQLRGRARNEVLAALRRQRTRAFAAPDRPTRPFTVTARSLVGRQPRPLPRPPRPPAHTGPPAPLLADPPLGSGVSAAGLTSLAADAARRALELANGEGDGGLGLTFEEDLARRAEPRVGTPGLAALASRAGFTEKRLLRMALAWRYGGRAGLAVLDDRWEPPGGALDEAREAVIRAGLAVRPRVVANVVQAGLVQLRLGRDGQWYRLERRGDSWNLVAPCADEPATLLGG